MERSYRIGAGDEGVKAWVGVTDTDWYRFLSARPDLDEVNFWKPSAGQPFRALQPGELFLFKLRYPENAIVGGGYFVHYSEAPSRFAWDAFGEKNGAPTYEALRARLLRLRHGQAPLKDDWPIGCILLQQPFFFERSQWIPAPSDFKKPTQQGKTYDLTAGIGRELFVAVQERLSVVRVASYAEPPAMYGAPVLVKQRLGQGSFRMLIKDLYEKRCAVTGEKVLPVLQAAHIQPVSAGGTHRLDNGLFLRSDIHTLFDQGYVTVDLDLRLRVSSRLKKDFDNGEHYYQYEGRELWSPRPRRNVPASSSSSGIGTRRFSVSRWPGTRPHRGATIQELQGTIRPMATPPERSCSKEDRRS